MARANRSNRPLLAMLALLAIGILVAVFWLRSGADSSNDPTPSANSLRREASDSVADDSPSGSVVRRRDRGAAPNQHGTPRAHTPVAPTAPSTPSTPSTLTVNGRVTDKLSRQPVAQVDVIFSSGSAEQTATSNAEGQFALSVAPGTYDVRAVGDRVVGIGLPALSVSDQPKRYNVEVIARSVIRGHVRYRDGRPAEGAIVVAYSSNPALAKIAARGELGSAEAERDGSFELFTLHGKFVLLARHEGRSGNAIVANLGAGEVREHVDIEIAPNGFVAGRVTTPKGAAIKDATVLISARVPETWNYDRVPVKTDARGRFRYRVPRAGHTVVEAMADGYAQSAPVAFTLAPSESREDIQLVLARATLRIVGHVYDATGAPLPFVQVALGQEGSKARYKQARTDAEGRFQFTGLGPGPHHLRARKAGYKQTRKKHISAPAKNITITMPAEAP